jgi:acetyl-CoA carboxylase biotin carboxyl carrier protein
LIVRNFFALSSQPDVTREQAFTTPDAGDRSMELSDADVLEILRLFEQSKFEFLELQHGDRKITVSKAGAAAMRGPASAPAVAAPAPAARPPVPRASAAAATRPEMPAAAPGLVPITAPMVGKFYASASPADPPYVQQGNAVAAGTTIGLIEVMKTFTSIKTESAGVIEQILVASGDYVEFGQTLFMLRTDGTP